MFPLSTAIALFVLLKKCSIVDDCVSICVSTRLKFPSISSRSTSSISPNQLFKIPLLLLVFPSSQKLCNKLWKSPNSFVNSTMFPMLSQLSGNFFCISRQASINLLTLLFATIISSINSCSSYSACSVHVLICILTGFNCSK
uniref:(northern house mosquito) hypothetical protein n=1 Tax=Culex pipiens TaxID=7175 RepID=A0A8D7ZYQ5_CULPI